MYQALLAEKETREKQKGGRGKGDKGHPLSLLPPPLKSPLLNSKPDIEAIKSGGM